MGIQLERIYPGQPQQNGRHERMHGTLKGETCDPPEATPADQQRRFDLFRQEFNDERPHEALGQETPVTLYSASPRPFPERLQDPCYGPDELVSRVRTRRAVHWTPSMGIISETLGLENACDGEEFCGTCTTRAPPVH